MENAPVSTVAPGRSVFEDQLGRRHPLVGTAGEPLEVFEFRPEFSRAPAFEAALRERVAALATFQNSCFPRVRSVQRVRQDSKLVLLSERAPGMRLSSVLTLARERGLPLEMNTTLCVIRQLVEAVAALHERRPAIAHGAISSERLVVTPHGRVMIADYVLGPALEHMQYASVKYWKELHVPVPRVERPHLDQQTDLLQIGVVALSLILGRDIDAEEYPDGVAHLVDGAWCVTASGGIELLPAQFRGWLARVLQLDRERMFASAVDAWAELERLVHDGQNAVSPEALECFMREFARVQEQPTAAADSSRTIVASPAATPSAAPAAASAIAPASESARGTAAVPQHGVAQRVAEPASATAPTVGKVTTGPRTKSSVPTLPIRVRLSKRWAAAAAAILAISSAGVFSWRSLSVVPAAVAEGTGTLVVNSNPSGVRVVIDGVTRGVTPLTVELSPGSHDVVVAGEGDPRLIPIKITAGGTVSHTIDLPKTSSQTGQLTVRSEPAGARVLVDDVPIGTTPLTLDGLVPGTHSVSLSNDATTVKQTVTIDPGVTASLVVPMTVPQGVPVSGWITVASPAEVQVFEGGRLLGSSRTDRIMVAAGSHDLELVNEALGFRSMRSVVVTAGKVSPIRVEWPKGTMAINAHPWAEVWVDGERVGETPIGGLAVPIGPHEVVFRHPELGEKAVRVVVTAGAPTRVGVDLRK